MWDVKGVKGSRLSRTWSFLGLARLRRARLPCRLRGVVGEQVSDYTASNITLLLLWSLARSPLHCDASFINRDRRPGASKL